MQMKLNLTFECSNKYLRCRLQKINKRLQRYKNIVILRETKFPNHKNQNYCQGRKMITRFGFDADHSTKY